MEKLLIIVSLEIVLATVVDVVVDDCRIELHADYLQ
jgi:hypothetical protein